MTSFEFGWKKLGITRKFSAIFILLLALLLLIACTGYFSSFYIRRAEEKIQKSRDIAHYVLEMDRGMERAYRLHGDFFLHFQHLGLQKAHELYAQPSVREIARVIDLSNEMRRQIFGANDADTPAIQQTDVNLYIASAKRFASTSIESFELLAERAAPERGLEAQIAVILDSLADELPDFADFQVKYTLASSFYKDYLIQRQRFLMQSSFNEMSSLIAAINQDNLLSSAQKESSLKLIDRYIELADKLLAVDLAIAGKLHDFYLQSQAVAPISEALVQLTREEVKSAEQRIATLHAIHSKIIPLTTLLAILMLLYISRLIHHSITRNVLNLAKAAADFSEGNLESRVAEESSDELGRLAAIFNNMATRLKDLIDNLELKVARRTEDLARSEERFRQLFDHSSSGVIVYEPVDNGRDFIIRDFNRAGEEIERISRAELIGRPVTEIFPGLLDMGLLETFRQVLVTGEPMLHPAAYYKDERIEGWRENRVYKLPSGEIVSVYDDVTQQIRAEEEKQAMAHSLQRAQKMEAIGLMAGGIAHDLNNTLSAIVGYPELLLLQLPEDSSLRRPLVTIKEAGERAAAVIADLLTVARGAASTRQTANLNVLVREYLNSPEFGDIMSQYPQIHVEQTLAERLPDISCSPIHVKKCLMNLVANSAESISQSGSITLTTFVQVPDQELANRLDLETVRHAVLRVTDSGPCIQESDLNHIFEPFYTKRAMGKRSGTGLGLSVVWNAMKDHAGAVVAASNSAGTQFDLYFPASAESVTTPAAKQQEHDLRGAGETILVIDDELQQCHLASKILEHFGYKVAYSNSGEEAVEYLESHQADLLILDMIMAPGMNGRQTYAEIRKIHPEQKAIIASGFSESEDVKATLQMGAGAFIKKPYSMNELALAVRNTLHNQICGAEESADLDMT